MAHDKMKSALDIAIALLQLIELDFHQQEAVGRLLLADAAMQRALQPELGSSLTKFLDELGPLESALVGVNKLFAKFEATTTAERLQDLVVSLEEYSALCWNELARFKRLDAEGYWDDPEEVRKRWLAPDDDRDDE